MPLSESPKGSSGCFDVVASSGTGSLQAFVTEVGANDVLLGRGAPIINNEGNVRFRELVTARKERYWSSSRSERKAAIANEIIDIVSERGGKFLRKVEDTDEREQLGISPGSTAWLVVDESVIIQKVKQALREKKNVFSSVLQDTGSSDFNTTIAERELMSPGQATDVPNSLQNDRVSESFHPNNLLLPVRDFLHSHEQVPTINTIINQTMQQRMLLAYQLELEQNIPSSGSFASLQRLQSNTNSILPPFQQQFTQPNSQLSDIQLLRLQLASAAVRQSNLRRLASLQQHFLNSNDSSNAPLNRMQIGNIPHPLLLSILSRNSSQPLTPAINQPTLSIDLQSRIESRSREIEDAKTPDSRNQQDQYRSQKKRSRDDDR